MKRLSKFLFYMLIGLLVAPLFCYSLQPQVWRNNTVTSNLTNQQTLTVGVDLVALTIFPNPGNSQLVLGHWNPPTTTHLGIKSDVSDNYAEFVITGAKGYWFHYDANWHATEDQSGEPSAYKNGSPNGVHLLLYHLEGADETNYPTGDFYQIQPGGNQTFNSSGVTGNAKLGNGAGHYWIRAIVEKVQIDVGTPHGDYSFPVDITVSYTGSF
jgi:hypothetical protein